MFINVCFYFYFGQICMPFYDHKPEPEIPVKQSQPDIFERRQ